MTFSEALPVAAISVSLVSLAISFLGFFRDRARLNAWAEIVHVHGGPGPDDFYPVLRIRVANLGRRPIVLVQLGFQGKSGRWFEPINQDSPTKGPDEPWALFLERIATLELAQTSAVRLNEADVVDVVLRPEDGSRLILTAIDPIEEARRVFFMDAAGRRYRVRNDAVCIEQLLSAFWSGTQSHTRDLSASRCGLTHG